MGKKVQRDAEMEIHSERIKKKVTNIIYNTDNNSLHSELQMSGVFVGKYYIYVLPIFRRRQNPPPRQEYLE